MWTKEEQFFLKLENVFNINFLGNMYESIFLPIIHEMKYLKRERMHRTNSTERKSEGRGEGEVEDER